MSPLRVRVSDEIPSPLFRARLDYYPLGAVTGELRDLVVVVCRHLRTCFDPWVKLLRLAWSVFVGLLPFTRVLVVIIIGPHYPLVGSVLHGSERDGRWPSPAIAWYVR